MSMRGLKNKDNNHWRKWGIFLFLLLLSGVLINSVSKVYQKKQEAKKALIYMQTQVDTLKKRNEFLQVSAQRMTTQEGIEFEIRKKLNVAEVGEQVAIIVEEEPVATTSDQTSSFWQKIKNFFLIW